MSITQMIAKHTDNSYNTVASDRIDPSEKKERSKYYYRRYRLYHHARVARNNHRAYRRHREQYRRYAHRYWKSHPERRAHDYKQKRSHYWRDRVRTIEANA